ncbi:DUF4350 domain-containing protein [Caulobacter sp. 1776]|uniref:DUF4350 domain-containing protein n=1 Tax=Caulobacter sp. 1776 TaxID=3156420 RepID=UPI0033957B85
MSAKSGGNGGFSPMTMVVLVLVGVISIAGLGVLSAYAPELKKGDDGGPHALSRSSVGYAALVRLLQGAGEPVLTSRGNLPTAAEGGLIVLTPAVGLSPADLGAFDDNGPVLVVLPKWRAVPDPRHRGWVRTLDVEAEQGALSVLPEALRKGLVLKTGAGEHAVRLSRPTGQAMGGRVRIRSPRTLAGPGWTPVLLNETGQPVLVMHAKTQTYVLADPDFLNTQGLKTLDGARTAVAILGLIRAPDTPVIFDLTLHGFKRTRSLIRLAVEPPLLGATLVLVALGLLAGGQAAVRFGPARPTRRAVALGKTALADNTAGLIRLARREHRMAPLYAGLIRTSAARAIGAPRGLEGQALDDFLDRASTTVGAAHTYSALADRARDASASDLMRVARDLHAWKQELIRGRP